MRLGYLLMNQKHITIAIAGSVHTHTTRSYLKFKLNDKRLDLTGTGQFNFVN